MLLDTHVLLALVRDPALVRPDCLAAMGASTAQLFVSAVSVYEIVQKVRLGKLRDPGVVATWAETLTRLGADEVPLTGRDAIEAGQLEWGHRDPFDRMIVAQARLRHLRLVTRDARVLDSGLVATMVA